MNSGVHETGIVVSCSNEKYQITPGAEVVAVDKHYYRPTEVDLLIGDATKAKTKLGWQPTYTLPELIKEMVEADIRLMNMQLLLKEQGYHKTIS